jgi:hypothetical protein
VPPPAPAPLPGPHPGMGNQMETATTGNDEKSLYDLMNKNIKTGIYDSLWEGFKQNISALSQNRDIRGPSTDAPEKGIYEWHVPPPIPAPLPGPHPEMGPSFKTATEGNDYGSLTKLLDAPHSPPGLYDSEDIGWRSIAPVPSLA